MLNIMFCGAGDSTELLPVFKELATDIGFVPLNFADGSIYYHNYGISQWERNSVLTVSSSDLLVFVINKYFGKITWEIELEEAISRGKNFIIFCRHDTYFKYRYHKDERIEFPTEVNARELFLLLNKLETNRQITIIPFNYFDFKIKFKEELMKIVKLSFNLIEKENKKNSFLPILMSSKFNNLLSEHINPINEKVCYEIVFDFFENKEIRKRALEYFKYSKTLTDDELVNLCTDMEQGVKRKVMVELKNLISNKNNIEFIFEEIITIISNDDDIGMVRRAIITFVDIDLENSIKCFALFMPASDIGTPKRIISVLKEKEEEIELLISEKPHILVNFVALIKSCLEYTSDKNNWRNVASDLLEKYSNKSNN